MDILDNIAEKVVGVKQVVGVQVQLSSKAEALLSYVELRKEKGIVVQLSSAENISMDQFCEKVSPEIPLCLGVSGKGILTKRVANSEGKDLLDEVLPHANKEEFYFSVQEEGSQSFISLGRIDLVNSILEELRQRKFTIVDCQLGFSSISTILPFLEGSEIDIGHMQLVRGEGFIRDFNPSRREVAYNMLGEEKITPACTLPYSHGLQLLLGADNTSFTSLHFREEWLQKELHKKLVTGILAFFFVLLLSNFFIFSNLSEENNSLMGAIGQHQYQLNHLQQLEKELKVQQGLYTTLGVGKQTFFAFYADRLAASIESKSIKLKRMEIQPLVEDRNRSLSFEKEKILVTGSCDNPIVINSWLEKLEKEEWVRQVRNRRYLTHPQSGEGEFSFELFIQEP